VAILIRTLGQNREDKKNRRSEEEPSKIETIQGYNIFPSTTAISFLNSLNIWPGKQPGSSDNRKYSKKILIMHPQKIYFYTSRDS
jgi:hypothetical protein